MPEASPLALPDASPSKGTPRGNALRQRLLDCKRAAVEDAVGKSDSWVRDLLDGSSGVRLDDFPRLLAALGLKLVDESKYCVDRELYDSYPDHRGEGHRGPARSRVGRRRMKRPRVRLYRVVQTRTRTPSVLITVIAARSYKEAVRKFCRSIAS